MCAIFWHHTGFCFFQKKMAPNQKNSLFDSHYCSYKQYDNYNYTSIVIHLFEDAHFLGLIFETSKEI